MSEILPASSAVVYSCGFEPPSSLDRFPRDRPLAPALEAAMEDRPNIDMNEARLPMLSRAATLTRDVVPAAVAAGETELGVTLEEDAGLVMVMDLREECTNADWN